MVCLPVTSNIKCLRGVCNERLKYEVEYSLKKGTSENSYLIKVGAAANSTGYPCNAYEHYAAEVTLKSCLEAL